MCWGEEGKKTKTEVPTLDFLIAYFPDRCDTGTHETGSISEKVAASRCAKNAGSRRRIHGIRVI